jgi:rare lipoprotein A
MTRVFLFCAIVSAIVGLLLASRADARRESVASYFGPGLWGNTMFCGGTLQPWTNGVAHRTLACGTKLVVCFRHRCAATVVRDRGPFVAGRDLDLSAGLASRLGFGGVHLVRWHLRR